MKLTKIHEDKRGSIHVLTGDLVTCHEITILKTNQGYMRGGCYHYHTKEYLFVVEGMIELVLRSGSVELRKVLGPGMSWQINPCVAHYFEALSDCIVQEYGPSAEEKTTHDEEYRKRVTEHNTKRDSAV